MNNEPSAAAKHLRAYFMEGMLVDVYVARESLNLIRFIGTNGEVLRQSTFDPFLRAVDRAMFSQFVLALTRLFDPASSRYEVRSIPAVLSYVRQHAADLPLQQRHQLEQRLTSLGIASDQLNDTQLTLAFLDYNASACPRADGQPNELGSALMAVRTRRDKRIAHSEHADESDFPEVLWREAESLLAYAEEFLDCVGFAFLGIALSADDGYRFVSESDAVRATVAFRRLLTAAGIVPLSAATSARMT